MTEENIFKILLGHYDKDNFQLEYPTLQPEVVNKFSKHLTEIIYESLKTKSSSSNSKRNNILKLVNSISEVKDAHINVSVEEPLNIIQNNFEKTPLYLQELKTECIPLITVEDVTLFYNNKNVKIKEKLNRLEYIKKCDQQVLDEKLNITMKKTFTHCDIKEDQIQNVLRYYEEFNLPMENNTNVINTKAYRAQQVKLGYALLIIKNSSSKTILEKIITRLSKYKPLEDFEEKFLRYLWLTADGNFQLMDMFINNFFFILERIIIEKSKEILTLNENNIHEYFVNLEDNKDMLTIRNICRRCTEVFVKIRSLIYELYTFCFCNKNILKLCKFIK